MEEINPRKIKAAMVMDGITQVALAKEMNITKSAVSHFFNPNNNTGWKTLNKIIVACNKLRGYQ